MAKLEPYKGGVYLWQYLPSLAAAVIFTIVFIVATVFHFIKLSQWRARFSLPFAIGGIFVHLSLISIRWLTKTFVMGDVVSFLVQGRAAGLMVSGNNATLGKDMVVVGLMIQIIMFGFFVVTAMMFQIRLQRRPTPGAVDGRINWRGHLHLLYSVSLLIMVRSLFRVVEYVLGDTGYPLTHEWTLYTFDALLMALAMVAWLVWYPGKLARPDMGLEMLNRHERANV
ncbi:hypothetical protein BO94DRAFT_558759 [Aspergillus sclerotioniger CBS 115572]|uniref:RTA1 like protein n=1 Tax=Aspergillus sclerotioniger CBS 115572 TaxID=1450535 RepID=A0A317VXC6_9EURO|nr:hypothetical protein BO94DRAFT_558759 [Aspergillus sclerotioniger CBS 115572]PWY78445.1 hypothetical protein BO94DRAFT_558759 [Aspergillus sclerotioniger CBS 115572]